MTDTPNISALAMRTKAAALMATASQNCRDKFIYPPKTKEQRDYQTGALLHGMAATAILALPLDAEADAMVATQASHDILAERQRQISAEGWTPEHDDQHDKGEMAIAAACYALSSAGWLRTAIWEIWPNAWGVNWFKPTYTAPRRDLVKAGALILAEIERLDRAAQPAPAKGGE